MKQALGEHEDYFIIRSVDFPILPDSARVARCKEESLLQLQEPPLGVDGDSLEWDQDHLQPEKPHTDLRVLRPAALVQEEPLQPPDVPSQWVADPVARALSWRLEPFDGPRASRRRPGCCLRHRSLLLLGIRESV